MSKQNGAPRIAAILTTSMLLLTLIPIVSAADVSLTAFPITQEADPGETAEYTINVRNNGENDMTVTLSTTQGDECTGYSSTVEQVTGAISSGDSEDVNLYVNLTNNAAESCETTVSAVATEGPADTSPGQADVTVTTTRGDGSGGALYGVKLETNHPESKEWDGDDVEVVWPITVENTGQVEESIDITIIEDDDKMGCDSNTLESTVDPEQVTIEGGESEDVVFTVEVPADSLAKLECWIIEAQVTNAPPGQDEDNITDELELDLEIPEIIECSFTGSGVVSVAANPFETATGRFTVQNDGNTEFWVQLQTAGSKSSWVDDIDPNSELIAIGGTATFDVEVTPDDSVSADSTHTITVRAYHLTQGSAGDLLCSSQLQVTVGQYHDGSVSFDRSALSPVQPGENGIAQIEVVNEGNGPDTFTLQLSSESQPAGWSALISSTSITVAEGAEETVEFNVSVPPDALADVAVVYVVELLLGNQVLGSDEVSVPVGEHHGLSVEVISDTQSGRTDASVSFPITIENTGNVQDTFDFQFTKNTDDWEAIFYDAEDSNGIAINSVTIPARATKEIIVRVTIEGEGEGETTLITIQVTNRADPVNLLESHQLTARSSNMIFRMNAWFDNPGDNPNTVSVVQPPGGNAEIVFWVQNSGDYAGQPFYEDNAQFELRGLEGYATRTLSIATNGEIYDGSQPVAVPMLYALKNKTTGQYAVDSDGNRMEYRTTDEANETLLVYGMYNDYTIELFALRVSLSLDVNSNTEDGYGATLYIDVSSEHNAAEVKTLEIVLSVQTIHDLKIEALGSTSKEIEYPDVATFDVLVTNDGNIEETVEVLISEGLRGWVPLVSDSDDQQFRLDPGESRLIRIKVEPPESTLEDEYDFTVSAQPKDVGLVGRVNLELTVILPKHTGILPSISTMSTAGVMFLASIALAGWRSGREEIS